MTLEEVKSCLYQTAEKYFAAGTVIWAEQANTKPPPPYMTLKIGSLSREAFPIEEEETVLRQRAYQCGSILEVNLYTKGKQAASGENATVGYANTALSSLAAFSSYLESDLVTDMLAEEGIAVSLMPPVRDLTFLENAGSYRYRAMAEYTVSFAMEADGAYGISRLENLPDITGGGNAPESESSGNSGEIMDSESAENTEITGTEGDGTMVPDTESGRDAWISAGDRNTGESDAVISDTGTRVETAVTGSGSAANQKEQDFSDGGTKELADTLIGTIKEVEITGEWKYEK